MSGQSLRGGRVRSRDGTSIGYLSIGAGPPLVCLHGALTTGIDWLPVARRLADRYRMVLVDRRGHGASDVGAGGHTIELEIADLEAVLEATGPARALLAHSFGAVIAMYAAASPLGARLGSLVAYDPPLMLTREAALSQLLGLRGHVESGDYEAGVVAAVQSMLGMTDEAVDGLRANPRSWAAIVALAPSLAVQARIMADVAGIAEPFEQIELPTLLLVGEHSGEEPFELSIDTLADVIPKAHKVVLTGQGHSALARAPAMVAARIADFLEPSRWPGRGP